jgi:hypothetical protein
MVDKFEIVGPDTPAAESAVLAAPVTPEKEAEAPLSTPLRSIRERRENLVDGLYLDHQIPRWHDPELFVRLNPVVTKRLNARVKAREVQGKKDDKIDWQLLANCDLLVDCCAGIYAVWPDNPDVKASLDGKDEWSLFDQRTAVALGVENEAQWPEQLVRKVFFTDGDIITAANALINWSNAGAAKADEDF